jgi:hypothetical protein
MADLAPTPDPPPITREMAEQVMRQGELYLQAQLQSALASDQRALTMAAFFGSVGTAVAAGAIAYWDRSSDWPTLLAGLVAALLMIVGACICLWAARPVNFYVPGNHPERWFKVIRKPLFDVMLGEAENYQEHIEANERHLTSAGRAIIGGASLALGAPVIAIVLWVFLASPSSSAPAATDQAETRLSSSSSASAPH